MDASPGAPTGVRRFALLASRDAVHPADEAITRRVNRDRAVTVSGIFREVDVVQRDRPAEIVEADGAVGEGGDRPGASLGAMVVLNTTRRALHEEHMAQRGDGLVVLEFRAAVVVSRRLRQHLDQEHRVEQAHPVAVDHPATTLHPAVGVGVEARRADVDALIAAEGAASTASEQEHERARDRRGDVVVLGLRPGHGEHLAVEELVPDGAPRLQKKVLLFAPVHLSRGAEDRGETLHDVEAAHRRLRPRRNGRAPADGGPRTPRWVSRAARLRGARVSRKIAGEETRRVTIRPRPWGCPRCPPRPAPKPARAGARRAP